MLGAFLFRGDDVHKSLSVLSGGEKSRLALLRILLKPVNLLILDEPTNHLDLQSKDILLDTLRAFGGTIIFVSHDRGFMEALSTKTLEFAILGADREDPSGPALRSQCRARLFYGNYGYYLDRLEREGTGPGGNGAPSPGSPSLATGGSATTTGAGLGPGTNPPTGGGTSPPGLGQEPGLLPGLKPGSRQDPQPDLRPDLQQDPQSDPRLGLQQGLRPVILIKASQRREAEKQRQTLIRRLERQEAEILGALEELEAEKARLEAELSRPEVYSSGEKARAVQAKLRAAAAAIDEKNGEWELKARELEQERRRPTEYLN
jgi:ATP-binding cassette subfamily F protein 3